MSKLAPKARKTLGTCLKQMDRTVLVQNDVCKKFCGNKEGTRCDTGCMKHFSQNDSKFVADLGFHLIPNLKEGDQIFDAIVVNDGENLTTVLLPRAQLLKKMISAYEDKGPTPAEISIVSLALEGQTNTEIAKGLFISRQTLKTHLNNINKKVPASLRVERLRKRFHIIP